jgi:hypothetical protein
MIIRSGGNVPSIGDVLRDLSRQAGS